MATSIALGSPANHILLVLHGGDALPSFRRERLLPRLQELAPGLEQLDADYWYLAEIDGTLEEAELTVLERLVCESRPTAHRSSPPGLLVVPRIGTISPWSTKATDIARHCGLTKIRRLERGTAWFFTGTADPKILAPLLHD